MDYVQGLLLLVSGNLDVTPPRVDQSLARDLRLIKIFPLMPKPIYRMPQFALPCSAEDTRLKWFKVRTESLNPTISLHGLFGDTKFK